LKYLLKAKLGISLLYVALIFGTVMLGLSCKEQRQDMKIIYYHRGEEIILNPTLTGFTDLIKTVENLLINADDMLRLAVEPEMINKMKKEERVLEIIYPNPIELTINRNRDTIHPDRLLIPLSGEFVGKNENPPATIFHGYPEYSAGPYSNHNGLEGLNKILYDMGIK
jgi:hypothetical protein